MWVALLVSFLGVLVAGLAGVLGVWMERDARSSLVWPMLFSCLILFATGVELVHTGYQTFIDARTDIQLATLLGRLSDLAANNPELDRFVASELAMQERANPGVVRRLERSVSSRGGDPSAVRNKASEGRRNAAGVGPAQQRPPRKERPEASKKADAPAPAPEPVPEEVIAAAASGDPDAAVAAAQAKAKALLADANKQAEAIAAEADKVKAQAEALQKQADAAMAQAQKVQKQAEAALKQAQSAAGAVKSGGDAAKKAKDQAKDLKVPGL